MNDRWFLVGVLLLMGACWGVTIPLGKIAVSTGHQPFGLIFWQLVVVVFVLLCVNVARRKPVVLSRRYWRLFLMIALCGALLPDLFFYASIAHIPAGVSAIILASVPLFSLSIALSFRIEAVDGRKILGVFLGMAGIVFLAVPSGGISAEVSIVFLLVALLSPVFYATEGNLVAVWGTGDLDSVQTLLGGSLFACALALPLALGSGQWVDLTADFGRAEMALIASAAIHAFVYAGYVWLVGRAGSVFAAQLSYIVNGFGIFWAMVLLGESYSLTIWLAIGVMGAGIMMVRPVWAKAG